MSVYKRIIVILITGIMLIGLVTFCTGKPVQNSVEVLARNNDDVSEKTTVTPTAEPEAPSSTPIPTPTEVEPSPEPTNEPVDEPEPTSVIDDTPNPLLEEIYPDIHELIDSYYVALTNADIDALKELVTDPQYISTETIEAKSKYIRGYTDIKCYTKRGNGDIKFVAYCTYNMSISTLETPIASLESFLIKYIDGKPVIFLGIIDDETQQLLEKLDNDADVTALKKYTLELMNKARTEDPEVDSFLRRLINVVGEDEEEAPASSSGSGQETAVSPEPGTESKN